MGALAIPAAAFTDPDFGPGNSKQGAERRGGQVPSARPDLDRAWMQVEGRSLSSMKDQGPVRLRAGPSLWPSEAGPHAAGSDGPPTASRHGSAGLGLDRAQERRNPGPAEPGTLARRPTPPSPDALDNAAGTAELAAVAIFAIVGADCGMLA